VKPLCANATEILQTYGTTVSSFLRIDFTVCYGNASFVGASSPHEVQKIISQAHSNTNKICSTKFPKNCRTHGHRNPIKHDY
jgi:hypothetical protein